MNDWREQAKAWLVDLFTSPIMLAVYVIIGATVVIFVIVVIRIKRHDKHGLKSGTKASDLVRSGAIPGVKWPEPITGPGPSMIVEPTRPRRNVTKIVYVTRTDHGHMIRNGPDQLDVTESVQSVTIGDTQPIEVTSSGEASRREAPEHGTDRSEHEPDREPPDNGRARLGDDQDRPRPKPRRSRARSRRTPRRER